MPTDPTVVDRLTAELAHHINALDVICARINYPSLTVHDAATRGIDPNAIDARDRAQLIGSADAETEIARQHIASAVECLNRARSRTIRATQR